MTNDDVKKIKDLVEVVHTKVKHIDLSLTSQNIQITLIKDRLEVMDDKLDEHTDKIDALIADMSEAQDRLDTIWEKVSAESDQTKRDIHKIKKHLGFSMNSD